MVNSRNDIGRDDSTINIVVVIIIIIINRSYAWSRCVCPLAGVSVLYLSAGRLSALLQSLRSHIIRRRSEWTASVSGEHGLLASER